MDADRLASLAGLYLLEIAAVSILLSLRDGRLGGQSADFAHASRLLLDPDLQSGGTVLTAWSGSDRYRFA
jgi:hypothetical protein